MSYCPECGEKITKEDVFCPFCGISLKPIAPVEDVSMSETLVAVPAPVINKEALDALTANSGTGNPKPETQNAPVAEEKPSEPVNTSENVPVFSAGDTSENWTMKTESVEIPAEQLEDIRSLPLPSPFGDDPAVAPADENAAPSVVTSPPLSAEPVVSPLIENSPETENIDEVPASSIIQEPEIEDEKSTDESAVSESQTPAELTEPEAAPVDFPENKTETPAVEETSPAPELSQIEETDAGQAAADASPDSAVPDLNAGGANLTFDHPPAFFEQPTLGSGKISAPLPAENVPVEELPGDELAEPVAETAEPPIEMPDLPLILENQRVPTQFDSVQIIQKDEIEAENAKTASADLETPPAAVEETPAAESKADSRDERSLTTPNMGKSDTDGRKAAKLKPLDEGTILNGRYEIVRKIGGGGMGAVYLANDRNLGGVLRAVKEMVQSYIESEQQDKAVADFKRESLLLTSLDHPAIPTIYDYFFDEKEGRFYLVMKYISGGDLASRLRAAPEGRVDEKSVVEWAIQIADVLHYLHNHEPSIVYRDLKPANVMIDGNTGRVMLIDFGIARWVNKEEKGVTAVGTMGYAPPELFSGNVEPRSDIYSLGSTIFHLLTGADPQSNPLLIFDFQKNPRPRQINSQLSDQIEQILMRSVEYNAEARFMSAAEMRDSLKEHLGNLQTGKVTYGVKVAPSNRAFSEQAVFCGFCGKQIVATDVFCAFCGAQQPIAQPGVSQSSVAVQPMTAKLIIQETGELEPSTYRLEKPDNLLGRRDPMSNIFPEVDLSKYDPQTKISRRHARIWREGNSFLVEDLGSSNGTTLLPSTSDSVRLLPHQPHTLTNGDKIKLGDTTLHFTIG
ncbi:MAG TPA: protein kinase [Pyrinomonadaceae bacterium]|jgi:serine/threonine-protein kinase